MWEVVVVVVLFHQQCISPPLNFCVCLPPLYGSMWEGKKEDLVIGTYVFAERRISFGNICGERLVSVFEQCEGSINLFCRINRHTRNFGVWRFDLRVILAVLLKIKTPPEELQRWVPHGGGLPAGNDSNSIKARDCFLHHVLSKVSREPWSCADHRNTKTSQQRVFWGSESSESWQRQLMARVQTEYIDEQAR